MSGYGPLTTYVKLRVARAPGMKGTFSHLRVIRKPLVNYPGMHHGCMSRSLNRGGDESVPSIPDACATPNYTYLARGPWKRFLTYWLPMEGICQSPVNSYHKGPVIRDVFVLLARTNSCVAWDLRRHGAHVPSVASCTYRYKQNGRHFNGMYSWASNLLWINNGRDSDIISSDNTPSRRQGTCLSKIL